MSTKKEVVREHLERYLKAPKEEKTRIISSVTESLGLHRKSVVRAFRREQLRGSNPRGRPGRRLYYGKDVSVVLKNLWEISGELCAERLHPILSEYVRVLSRDKLWQHDDPVTGKLLAMSLGTMKTRVGSFVRAKLGGGRSTTKPSDLKELIPIRRGPWQNPAPGYGEIDTVVHSGSTLSGIMAYTVNFTDISTMWDESVAQMNKGMKETLESIKKIKKGLPFPLLGLDPDTGSEFINWHLKKWCDKNNIEITRSRPNHKNDNAHIEQRNFTGVRKFLGYSRIDEEEAVVLLDELYRGPLRLYRNFFQPSSKCLRKVRIGSKYIRRYDTAKTPYQRVLEDKRIDEKVKERLRGRYAKLNPLTLKREVDALITRIFKIQRHGSTPKLR